jgi:uncharacterized repeat protein (TIGR03803 family)
MAAIFVVAGCNGGAPSVAPAVSMGRNDRLPAPSSTFKRLYSFKGAPKDGAYPDSLTVLNGVMYGTTSQGGNGVCNYLAGCGTVFSVTQSGREKVLYAFQGLPNDGANPEASRMIALNGTLYGTTSTGGSGGCKNGAGNLVGCGIVFSVSVSGQEKVLYNFQGGQRYGAFPTALVFVKGAFYGTTQQGGSSGCGGAGCGTVFSLTASGQEKVVYSFATFNDGNYPSALIDIKGKLYGTTTRGGSYYYCACGTFFSLATSGNEKTLYSFRGYGDAADPQGNLVYVKGKVYGASTGGGFTYCYDSPENGCGTVYSITTSGQEQVLHSFSGVYGDGALPYGGLIASKGVLYGTTYEGGNARTGGACDNGHFMSVGCGTVFSITTSGQENVLYNFQGKGDGGFPNGNLVALKGRIYGATTLGGTKKFGTIFKI